MLAPLQLPCNKTNVLMEGGGGINLFQLPSKQNKRAEGQN